MISTFNGLNKWKKRSIVLLLDVLMTFFSWISIGWLLNNAGQVYQLKLIFSLILIQGIAFLSCGLYRGIWHFASIPDLLRIIKAVLLGALCNYLFSYSYFLHPMQLYSLYSALLMLYLAAPRIFIRWLHDHSNSTAKTIRTLVIGAGNAAEGIIRDLSRLSSTINYKPIGMVDDDPEKLGCEIQGIRVLGFCKDIPTLVNDLKIELIIIAVPSLNSARMRQIVAYCSQTAIPFRTLPGLNDIADGRVTINSIREVLIEDLLGREQVDLHWQTIQSKLISRTVLVTGAGGSIGSELCRQIIKLNPALLVIVDNSEYNLYKIEQELRQMGSSLKLSPHLASVTDFIEMHKIFENYKPSIVFHVAAYKHVPLLEKHIRVAMHNNIIGTKTIAQLANTFKSDNFILISTDKAVNPTNIMGATKRAAEIFCQSFNEQADTTFLTVRFGNVLDSTGSVVPLFRQQLSEGGPITLTHKEITRFFMTIPEASQLILQAAAMEKTGDIMVLDMGEPISIQFLAEQMIKLSGKELGKDIEIIYTGLRPGEKLHEELFHEQEKLCPTPHPKIKQAKCRHFSWERLTEIIAEIEKALQKNDEPKLKNLLQELVPEYASLTTPSFSAAEEKASSILSDELVVT